MLKKINTLYITEKFSQVEDLAKVLDCKIGKKWFPAYNESKGIAIIPLQGHLYELYRFPEDYNADYKSWNESTVLCFPDKFKKKAKTRVIEQINRSIEHIKLADEIIIASDLDNEGANLAMTIVKAAACESKVTRMLEMGSTTEEALKRTLSTPTNIPFNQMSDAGDARAFIDWAEGMTLSRALTVYLGKGKVSLMYGGVKSPVIKFVVERDLAFESHAKVKYFTLSGNVSVNDSNFDISIYTKDGSKKEKKIDSKIMAEKRKSKILELTGLKIQSILSKNKKEGPKQMYDLIEISAELSRTDNATADDSLNAAQSLYDTFKIQSYPRTAIKYLKSEDYSIIPAYLENLKGVMHADIIGQLLKSKLLKRSTVFNSSKVTSHGALTPTEEKSLKKVYPTLRGLERSMFDKVSTRFIANFMPDYEYEHVFGEIHLYDNVYASFVENRPKKAGWKYIYDKNIINTIKNYTNVLPEMKKNDNVSINSIKITEGETKPKPRFKEDTLQQAMGNISNLYPEDEVLKEELGENGIGTPATIPTILKQLFATTDGKGNEKEPWLKMVGKNVVSTNRSRELVKVTPDEIMSPVRRAKMFKEIKLIEQGKLQLSEFLENQKHLLKEDIELIKELSKNPDNILKKTNTQEKLGKCPKCKKGSIFETPKAFICTEADWSKEEVDGKDKWKNNGCSYTIYKQALLKQGGKSITKTTVKKLLKDGEVKLNFINPKNNEKFEAARVISLEYGIGFPLKKEFDSIGKCPYCGKDILIKEKSFSCSGAKWKKIGQKFENSGCSYNVRFNQLSKIGGNNITKSQMKELLISGEVEVELKSQSGEKYKAKMVADLKWGLSKKR